MQASLPNMSSLEQSPLREADSRDLDDTSVRSALSHRDNEHSGLSAGDGTNFLFDGLDVHHQANQGDPTPRDSYQGLDHQSLHPDDVLQLVGEALKESDSREREVQAQAGRMARNGSSSNLKSDQVVRVQQGGESAVSSSPFDCEAQLGGHDQSPSHQQPNSGQNQPANLSQQGSGHTPDPADPETGVAPIDIEMALAKEDSPHRGSNKSLNASPSPRESPSPQQAAVEAALHNDEALNSVLHQPQI